YVEKEETVDPSDPVFPRELDITTTASGVEVSQYIAYGTFTIGINGESTTETFDVDINVPTGWDGFVIWKDGVSDNVTVNNRSINSRKAPKAIDETWEPNPYYWYSIDDILAAGYVKSNSFTVAADGQGIDAVAYLYKGDKVDFGNGFYFEGEVTLSEVSADPVFPTEIGVNLSNTNLTVEQAWNEEEERHKIAITGAISAEKYTVELDVPEGWTGFMAIAHDDNAVTMRQKAASATGYDWIPVSEFEEMGYVAANNFTITTGEEKQYIDLFLYKDDQVDYNAYIQLMSDVERVESTDPVFPRELDITTDAEGVEVTQAIEWDCFTVGINGESETPEVNVEINVPAGWDGFVFFPWTENVVVNESLINPRKAPKAVDETWEPKEFTWQSIDNYLEAGYVKSNNFTITANGEDIDVIAYLYKGDQVEAANAIYFEGSVICSGGATLPKFPVWFDVEPDNWDVEIWQGDVEDISISGVELTEDEQMIVEMMMPQTAIVLTGQTDNETVTANFNLPAGWEGILPIKINFTPYSEDDDYMLATRANESEFAPLGEYKQSLMGMMGLFDVNAVEAGNPLVFPANGEKQLYICNLYIHDDGTLAGDPQYADDYVDVANSFLIVVDVKSTGTGVESINALDADATYYDVNGNKIANPAKGIYVKVKDGKASKVAIK
ncbi:MAG: hypothetical protein K2K25_10920, partial [Muribaculaceae bacterium]|nr:hypothetical protein [Muribaculaceae bacterium]